MIEKTLDVGTRWVIVFSSKRAEQKQILRWTNLINANFCVNTRHGTSTNLRNKCETEFTLVLTRVTRFSSLYQPICESRTSFSWTGWSGRPGSNRRHLAWEANTLPTELRPRVAKQGLKLAIRGVLSTGLRSHAAKANKRPIILILQFGRPAAGGPACNLPSAESKS